MKEIFRESETRIILKKFLREMGYVAGDWIDLAQDRNQSWRPPLWSSCNIVTSHAAGLGSIPGGPNFLVEVFSGFFFTCKTNVRKL